ncbi:MAG: rRNA maturation RNase YbeY [Alphaproteobacteria bacterium]
MIAIDFNKKLKSEEIEIKNYIFNSIKKSFETLKKNQEDYYLSIFLTNNYDIKKLNNKYRKINKPTNVLSFAQDKKFFLGGSKQVILLGDIVISLEKIRSEAKVLGKKFSDHFTHMCIHGLLHLFGYNHKKESESKIMQEKEISILKKLSIPSPY